MRKMLRNMKSTNSNTYWEIINTKHKSQNNVALEFLKSLIVRSNQTKMRATIPLTY